MKSRIKKLVMLGFAAAFSFSLTACGTGPSSQKSTSSYPDKTVTMIVPTPSGTALDLSARALAQGFKKATGQSLVIENLPGGAMVPAAHKLIQSKADGYTIAMLPSGLMNLRPVLQNVGFTFPKDFTPILGVGNFQMVLAAKGNAPYNTMAEMVTYFKEHNKPLRIANTGANTAAAVVGIEIANQTKVQARNLPFNGGAAAVTAVLGNHADLGIVNLSNVYQLCQSGKIKILGVPAQSRYSNLQKVPTLKEQGINVTGSATFAIYGPANLPASVSQKLQSAFLQAMNSPQFKTYVSNTNLYVTKAKPKQVVSAIEQDAKTIQSIKSQLGK